MLEYLFIGATRDLKERGWTQSLGENPLLFSHPEFGTFEFFNACYIQHNADKVRRRLWWVARIRPAVYNLIIGGVFLFAAYKLITWEPLGILLR